MLMAMYGKTQSTHYTKKARRKLIAGRAAHKRLFTAEQKWTKLSHRNRRLKKVGQKQPKTE
ncbi:hypothetical protein NKH73_26750 [Mesorhizobium sp. M0938]|uniref:hypothetical protein n=1 Tax=unclassified Mesorhizobium TaxID=325217 RepID=UPI0033392CC2